MTSPAVRYTTAVLSVLVLASIGALVAQQPQPTAAVQAPVLQPDAPSKAAPDRVDVGDFYYFDGAPVALQRSLTETVVRFAAGQTRPLADVVREVSPQAITVWSPRASGRRYEIVRVPLGQRPASGREWADEFRQRGDVEFSAPVFFRAGSPRRVVPTDEIVVKTWPGTSPQEASAAAAAYGATLVRPVPGTADQFELVVAQSIADPLAVARALSESGEFEWAQPNFIQEYERQAAPNDPRFSQQWHLRNTGSLGGTAGADVKAVPAWDIETGKSTTVIAIVDEGVETGHEDLAANIFVNAGEVAGNGLDDDGNTFVDDVNGWDFVQNDNNPNPTSPTESHGTSVAGVAAGRGSNGLGISGACQNCRILPVRIGFGVGLTDTDFGNAIRYAARFADVINNSWGGGAPSAIIQSAIQFANTSGRGGKGSLVMFATGNSASGMGTLSVAGLPAGTHRFRWTYSKDFSISSGDDTTWLSWVQFPGGQLDTFQGGSLPAGWSTGGNASWSVVLDPPRVDEGMCLTRGAKAGTIGDSQSTYIEVVRTVPAGTILSGQWVSGELGYDGLSFQLDINNDEIGVPNDFDTGLAISGVPAVTQSVAYPAAHPEAIAVGASSDRDCRSSYSQFGPQLAFVAPSSGFTLNRRIEATDRMGASGYDPGNYTQAVTASGFGGTSSASPLAAGIAGLIVSQNSTLTRAQVLQIMQSTADKVGPEPYVSFRNNRYGFGRLNAHAALSVGPQPPTAVPDSYNTPFNTPLVVVAPGVLGNDNPNGGGTMSATLVTPSPNGTASLSSNGSFTFTPTSGFSGQTTFTYHASNTGGQSTPATVTITVGSITPPTANDDSYSVAFNGLLNIGAPGVLSNDNANGGGSMTAVLVAPSSNGTVNLFSSGGFTFTPTTGFSGPTTFTYRATNSGGQSNIATVNITVAPGPPTAVSDSFSTPHNTPLVVAAPGVLANDNANGGGTMTAVLVGNPGVGSLTLDANGGFTYTPTNGYSGSVSFLYKASTSAGTSPTASVVISIDPPPLSPPGFSVHPANRVFYEGQTARFGVGLTGNPFPTCVWQQSTDLGVTWTNTNLTLTTMAIPNVTLAMSGTQYRCQASNSQGTAASNAATLTVAAIAPGALAAGSWSGQTEQGQPMSFTLNAGPGQGSITTLMYSSFDGCIGSTVTFSGPIGVATNTFTHDSSGIAQCTTATRRITGTFGTTTGVSGLIVHDYPFTQPPGCNCRGTFIREWSAATGPALAPQVALQPVSTNPSAGQKAQFTAAATGTPTPTFQWEMSTNSGGSWNDVPSTSPFSGGSTPTLTILGNAVPTYFGAQFRARAQNASGSVTSNPARIGPVVGQPPTANPDSFGASYQTTLNVAAPGVLANDASNGGGAMAATVVTSTTRGDLTLNPNGSFSYTPNSGFVGVDTFTYRADNAAGPGSTALVTITVSRQVGAPTTNPDTYDTSPGVPLAIGAPGVLANDDANGGSGMIASLVSVTSSGTVSLSPDGSFTYTPNPGFSGTDRFTYRAVASGGPGNVATVSLTVEPPDRPRPPTNFRIVRMQGNAVTFAWTPPPSGPAPTGFQIEGGVLQNTTLGALSLGATPSVTLSLPTGSFFLRLRTIAGGQMSGPSNEIPANINVPVPPSAARGLLGLVNGSAVQLAWTPTFGGGAPTGAVLDVTGTLSGSVPLGPGDTFSYPAIPPGTYTFSVRQTNAGGSGGQSNAVTLSFPGACSGAPQVPVSFLAYKDAGQLYLLWEPPAGGPAPDGYTLHVTGSFTGAFPMGSSRALTVPGPPGSYTFSVSAGNACGSSAPTATQTVTFP